MELRVHAGILGALENGGSQMIKKINIILNYCLGWGKTV
jgi:hypothetical protein